jgi:hypothetical protein
LIECLEKDYKGLYIGLTVVDTTAGTIASHTGGTADICAQLR